MENLKVTVDSDSEGKRIDSFLANFLKDKSRSFFQRLIEKQFIKVNNNSVKNSYMLKAEDIIDIVLPEPVELNIKPENIPISIIYEDKDVIVVDKPQGMIVHPASGVYTGTLVNALLYHAHNLSGINGVLRPGIVHRIDKDTSGILVVAKNDFAHNSLALQFKEHTTVREYTALTEGVIKKDEEIIDLPLGRHPVEKIKMAVVKDGKRAVTHVKVIERYKENTLIKCILETGRTHQIRVHLAYTGNPLMGDPVYGYKKQKFNLNGQALHAGKLGFIHPTKGEYMEFNSELPDYFTNLINLLRKQL